jgi:hypothetical protein
MKDTSFSQIYEAFDNYSPGGIVKNVEGERILFLKKSDVEIRPNWIEIITKLNTNILIGIDKIEVV